MVRIKSSLKGTKFLGGNVCLDFVNTARRRVNKSGRDEILTEQIVDYDALIEWAHAANLLTPRQERILLSPAIRRRKAAASLRRAMTLRETLYRIFKAVVIIQPPDESDLEVFNRALAVALSHDQMEYTAGAFAWKLVCSKNALDQTLWRILLHAADLLTISDLSRLRQCASEKCSRMFLDESRNRSRRWCEMKDCGNLAKIGRFRKRYKESH